MGQTFYKAHLPALRYAECWHVAKNPFEFLVAAFLKTIGVSISPPIASACPDNLIRIVPGAVAPVLMPLLKRRLQEAEELGIEDGIWYTNPAIGAVALVGTAFRLPDGNGALVCATVHITQNGMTTDKKSTASFVTELASGRVIDTTAGKRELDPPPLSQVYDRHRERLSLESDPIVRINSEEDLENLCLRNEKATYDFNIERGVFVPVTDAEEAALRAATPATSSENPAPAAKGVLDMLCWFSIGFGFFKLNDGDPNQAQLIFRWSLIGGGFLGLALLATVRHFQKAA